MLLCAPKRDKSISIFLQYIKKVVDFLTTDGSPITIKDHIEAIFEGFPEEYDAFITFVTSKIDSYILEQVEALLLAQEERLEKYHTVTDLLQAQTASFSRSKFFSNNQRHARGSSRPLLPKHLFLSTTTRPTSKP